VGGGEESRRAETRGSLIISITYANLRGETGLDAIRSNYFTLAKRLLLVAIHVHGTRRRREAGCWRRGGKATGDHCSGV